MPNYDPRTDYWSSSRKQTIKIKEMDENHIINAILKEYRSWAENIQGSNNLEEVVNLLVLNPATNISIQSLVYELYRRLNLE